ncbi:MAG: 2-hydroxyacyl-CoA dehydratase family protein [Syntrophales bacterium]|jgi:bzd-type benzoyl-CoA reductase N subunit|nr:2-hydroxyacyl-CoA dehydratase family protein [Syntrophales bacterium]MCK9390895.1 2-hydroxyacyl-CoA dehydratase family protein [Syntrophales bacterium]
MQDILREMADVVRDPFAYGRKLKADTGKKIVGYVCTYAPEEMILAAGAHPLRLFGTTGTVERADAHLQSYCCSLVRGVLEEGLKGGTDFLDGMVFPHTCDSIQRLSDLWRMNVTQGFHFDAVLPVKLDTQSARQYMIDVLNRFRTDLERELDCSITDDNLHKTIRLMNEIRLLLRRIYELRSDQPGLMTGDSLYTIVKATMIMDRERVREVLQKVVEKMEAARLSSEEGAGSQGSDFKSVPATKRLLMAGGICNQPQIHDMIEAAGGAVIWDDFCTGSRYFETLVSTDKDPIRAIADRFLQRAVCPAKHAGLRNRAEDLIRMAHERKARGVIFLYLKFCDPHAFDYPYLKAALDQEGIPSLLLEVEDPLPAEGQLQTRFEAFLEML